MPSQPAQDHAAAMQRSHRRKKKKRSLALPLAALGVLLAGGTIAGALVALERIGASPRQLGPYLQLRAEGHNSLITGYTKVVADRLVAADRASLDPAAMPSWRIGAQSVETPATGASQRRQVPVADTPTFLQALAQARPGDEITLRPGTYRLTGKNIQVNQPGAAGDPITVRAAKPGSVIIESAMNEGFHVTVPHWVFENLVIRGVCSDGCDHAFHVVGNATGFTLRNNTISDFNAHLKINGSPSGMPDDGVIANNTLTNTAVRQTRQPVSVIDLVAGSNWRISGNLITDFIKGGGDHVSYGGFAKGAGSKNVFERNVVICEHKLRGQPGQRVGLSLGGGGTGADFCRDRRCLTEQDGGILQNNLIASCSDEGIYLNRAATSKILNNTLIDTAGIMARHAETSADITGNIIDGRIRTERNAIARAGGNLQSGLARLYLGSHPQRALFRAPDQMDFSWSGTPPRSPQPAPEGPDLCGAKRPAEAAYGAFEDFKACLRP